MSDPRDQSRPDHGEGGADDDADFDALDEKDDAAVSALLKRTLGAAARESEPAPDLLRGVQRKLRQRSKGKFYGDGWSTAQTRVNYVLIALIMLVLVGAIYFALGPTGLTAR